MISHAIRGDVTKRSGGGDSIIVLIENDGDGGRASP